MKKWMNNHCIDLSVAAILLFQLFISVPKEIYGYVDVWYVLDYSYGFGTRLMIGSILHLFLGDYISGQVAAAFVTGSLAVLCILLSILAGECFRKAKTQNSRITVAFFVALYVASPASPAYLWTAENFGRLETWLFIIAILLVFVYLKVSSFVFRCFLYTLLAILALTIHQVYFFLFFPSLCVLLLAEWNKGKYEKKRIIWTLCVGFIVVIVFIYMQFCSGIYYDDLTMLTDELRKHTDMSVSEPTLLAEYFWTLRDHIIYNQLPELRERVRFGIITMFLLMPMWLCIFWIKREVFVSSCGARDRGTHILMILTDIAFIPVFAMMTDWGRWFAALFSVQFLSFTAFAGSGEDEFNNITDKAGEIIVKYLPAFLMIILYCSMFEKFEGINYVDQVREFYYRIYDIKTALLN